MIIHKFKFNKTVKKLKAFCQTLTRILFKKILFRKLTKYAQKEETENTLEKYTKYEIEKISKNNRIKIAYNSSDYKNKF